MVPLVVEFAPVRADALRSGTDAGGGTQRRSPLTPYVPRLAAEWDLDHAGERWYALDASICFVDVTGFTTISERLAALGRLGAEQLTDLLDHVFSRLLTVAYDKGGTLLKFGGDALLLAFVRDDHPRLAVEAAVEMRNALAEASAETGVGRVALRASMGVHTGTVELYRVGETSRELLVMGPDCSTAILLERGASSGEILVSEALAARLPRAAVAAAPNGLRVRWRHVPAGGPGLLPAREVPAGEVEAWLPPQVRTRLTERAGESEHRTASLAFVRFSGADGLFERAGGDAVAEALGALVATAQLAAGAEGVTVLGSDADVDGGKLILAAGVPITQEDDEGRILKAARQVASLRSPLAVHVGVNRGAVFAGDVGTAYRRTFTVIGDAVNVAARLAGAAPPGSVIASAGVLERSRTAFDAVALGVLEVKGRRDPVPTWRVGVPTGVRHRATSALPFLGRDVELATLTGAVDSTATGAGGVAVIEGDRGAGKTRVVSELLRSVTDGREALRAQGESFAAGLPYHAFRDAVRALLGVSAERPDEAGAELLRAVKEAAPELAELAPLVAPMVGAALPSTSATEALADRFVGARTTDVLVRILDVLRPGPLVIVMEDAHWFDRASSELAGGLATASSARPWLVCVTRRPTTSGFVPQSPTWRVPLDPLGDAAVAALVDAGTEATPLRPQRRDAIVAKAGGNPLFVEELLRIMLEGASDAIPDSLDAIAMREIDALPGDARRVLIVASVLGRQVDVRLLRALAGESGSDLALEAVAEILLEDGPATRRFRHALLQEAAYTSIPFRVRRELHRRAGLAIEAARAEYADAPALLSLHFAEAQDAERTWRYARLAADDARRAHAPGEVRTHLDRAITAGEQLASVRAEQVSSLLEQAAEASIVTGDYEEADGTFRRADRRAGDAVARARIAERRAYVRSEYQGRLAAAIRQVHAGVALLDALPAAPRGATRVRAALLAREADVRARQGRLADAVAIARRAAAAARDAGDDMTLALAYSLLDQALAEGGRADEATHLPKALELYERLGALDFAAMTLGNLGSVAYWQWEWKAAASYYEQAAATATAAGDLATAAVADVNLGELRVDQGRAEEAVHLLAPALRTLTSFGFVAGVATARIHLGRATALAGDPVEGVRLLRETVEQLDATGIGLLALDARAKLCEVQVLEGDLDAARATLAEARRAERSLGTSAFATLLDRVEAVLAVATGDRLVAATLVAAATARARELGATYDLCVLLSLAERLGEEGGAEAAAIASGLGIVSVPSLASV